MSTSLAAQHSEWLSLVEISGPFLTLPVLRRALPLGLDPTPLPLVDDLRVAWSEVSDDDSLVPRWIRWVLHDLLELSSEVLKEGTEIGPAFTYTVPEYGVRLRPDFIVVDPDRAGGSPPARMLVMAIPAGVKLDERTSESKWSVDAVDRMAELCRGTGIRLGMVTNGDQWAVVDAPVGGATGVATWDANLWLEERLTLDAFTTLIGVRRFFSVAATDTLDAMLDESANAEAEVTDQLGRQVRAAVELLVDAMSRANRDRGGHVFGELSPAAVYEAAVTVMMRLVFLLCAEERGLFLLGDETYDSTYAVSTLRAQLEEEANDYGEEVIARRTDAWHRILATFRMVSSGAQHENLRLPAYGGSLFDPDRFSFLEGRQPGQPWRSTASSPIPIDNRTVLHTLGALQILTFTDRHGVREARRLSFRALDVEQIGHVYEGLLDHSAIRTDEVAVGLLGRNEPEIAFKLIEQKAEHGKEHLVDYLAKLTGLSVTAVEKGLGAEPDSHGLELLTIACNNDRTLADRIAPYLALLRLDLAGLPKVYLPDSVYVTQSSDRRSSGTYYTPRILAEEIVRHTLEPLVYMPSLAHSADPAPKNLKPSTQLLDLKVCDMAMGSGAFLVATCRYLSRRLLDAWEVEELSCGDQIPLSSGRSMVMPAEETDREILARRLVADSCLYGVDRNPMAVEMAKLSIWLITLAKDRPFTFIDHALRCGDSLLGITDLRQLDCFHLDPETGRKVHGGSLFDPATRIVPLVKGALEKRRQLESFPVIDVHDAEKKRRLFDESSVMLERLKVIGDVVIGAALSTAMQAGDAYETRLASVVPEVAPALDPERSMGDREQRLLDLSLQAEYWLDEGRPPMAPNRCCLHWPLEFPEVFNTEKSPGFDAVVGNPPFLGGVNISQSFGVTYEPFLKRTFSDTTGFVDLAVYFHRRANSMVSTEGTVGLLGPQNLTATANRMGSTDVILRGGRRIYWARDRVPWPGGVSIEVCSVLYGPGSETAASLNYQSVLRIGASLRPDLDLSTAKRLDPWLRYSEGSHLYGMGFVKPTDEWEIFVVEEPMLRGYLRPYVNAQILCDNPDFRSDLLAADFGEHDKADLGAVSLAVEHVEKLVRAERANQTKQVHESRPWLFWDKRTSAYSEARKLRRVLVCPSLSKHLPMVFVDPSYLFAKTVKFFLTEDAAALGILQSSVFLAWAVETSPMRGDSLSFSTKNSFDTYPQPFEDRSLLGQISNSLWSARQTRMTALNIGISDLLNQMHSPEDVLPETQSLRDIQVELDRLVVHSYGWSDLPLDHGFHETRQGERFTIGPSARAEVLGRLLQLNQQRFADQKGKKLHSDPKQSKKRSTRIKQNTSFDLGEV